MTRKSAFLLLVLIAVLGTAVVLAQDITAWIKEQGGKPALAVIDFRGSGSQQYMAAFNSTLFKDLDSSGLFTMKPKSLYPLNNPQRPEDLKPIDGRGFALADWSGPPVGASHLAFGYTAAQNGALVLYGYLDDARQQNPQTAQLLGKRYVGSLDEAGAVRVAHEFASDIIQQFGGTGTLLGSRIYYTSNRTGHQEIWAMDWDGNNQKQL